MSYKVTPTSSNNVMYSVHRHLENVVVGAASAASGVLVATEGAIVLSDTSCHVAWGAAPVATTASPLIPANIPTFVPVANGEKVAVLQSTAAGVASITEA